MIITKTTKHTVEVPDIITCDVCNIQQEFDHHTMISINHTCGYGSPVIGDSNRILLDICEQCFVDKLGTFSNIVDHNE